MILSRLFLQLLQLSADAATTDGSDKLAALKSLSLNDLLSQLIDGCVKLSISVVTALIVFYVGKLIITKLYKVVHKILVHRSVDASLTTFILSLVRIVLYFVLIIIVVGILGIETSSFLALFASAGVAIGMALSGTLQNFAGGVLILLLKPYKVGDFIEVQGYTGTVTEIQIFNTIINTGDNKSIIIPNGGLSTGTINNWSREGIRRIEWSIGISYGDSFATARDAILGIIKTTPGVITDDPARPMSVTIGELASSSVDLVVRAWAPTSEYWNIYFAVNERVYSELPSHGVSFPFPQLDVHVTNPNA